MKRDNDLIRKIALAIEGTNGQFGLPFAYKSPATLRALGLPDDAEADSWPLDDVTNHHLDQMAQKGLVTFKMIGSRKYVQLTASGHDFLEAIRDEGIWQKTKAAVAETGGSASLEIVKTIAVSFFKQQIKSRTGLDV